MNSFKEDLVQVLECSNLDDFLLSFVRSVILDWYERGACSGQALQEILNVITPLLEGYGVELALRNRILSLIDKIKIDSNTSSLMEMSDTVFPIENPFQIDLSPLTVSMRDSGKVSLDWLANKRVKSSQVDQDRLKRVISRHQMRAEKRGLRAESKNAKVTLKGPTTGVVEEYDPQDLVNQMIAEEDEGLDYRSSRDITLSHFDISIGGKRILSDASLVLAYGRRYGLVGRNGVGKSTLLRHISSRALEVPKSIRIVHVEQEIVGDSTTVLDSVLSSDYRRQALIFEELRLQRELQNSPEGDTKKIVNRLNTISRLLQANDSASAEARAASILAGLGFEASDQRRPTSEFSGGWRMRVALARALFGQPDLLLVDEPTNMLDFSSVVWLEKYLLGWKGTVFVVSHDFCFLDNITTDIMHMHNERLDTYRGNYSQFLCTKTEKLTHLQREYEAQMQYRQHLQSFIDRWRYNANRAPQAQSRLKILEKLPELKPVVAEAPIIFHFVDPEAISPPILQLDEVSFAYDESGTKNILERINFNLQPSSRVAIVGPNGSGKTTFLKLVSGAVEPTKGRVYRNGRLRIGYYSQHHVDQLDLEQSPLQLIQQRLPGFTDEEYRRTLGSFGLSGPLALQTIRTLSGGQKSRVVFAIISMQRPHVMVMDEPTNHLDIDTIDALIGALKKYSGGVLVVSHDKRFINSLCTEIWVCEKHRLTRYDGSIFSYANSLSANLGNLTSL